MQTCNIYAFARLSLRRCWLIWRQFNLDPVPPYPFLCPNRACCAVLSASSKVVSVGIVRRQIRKMGDLDVELFDLGAGRFGSIRLGRGTSCIVGGLVNIVTSCRRRMSFLGQIVIWKTFHGHGGGRVPGKRAVLASAHRLWRRRWWWLEGKS